jgi:hypothetical protein
LIEIDHVALATSNLYAGFMDFRRETGLEVIEGGYFEAFGIANQLIPTSNATFIEIESTIDNRVASTSPRGRWFDEVTADGPKWVGACLRVSDLDELQAIADRIGSRLYPNPATVTDGVTQESVYYMANGEPHPPQNRTPDGSAWQRGLPTFFVMDMGNHVGNTPLAHKRQPHGFSWLEMGGSEKRMQDWIGVHPDDLNIRCNGKAPGLYAVAVKTDDDDIVVRYDWE